LIYLKNENLYEKIKEDKSFGAINVFFLLENMPAVKNKIQSGEYVVKKGETAFSFMIKMLIGEKIVHKLTIPEGYTVKMIVDIINDNEFLFGEILDIPEEGSLMPDTYFYCIGDSKFSVINKMKNQMLKIMAELLPQNKTTLSMKEVLILASIIEKEAALAEERPLLSSVFHNRLLKKMRLQSDPTVIYAISNGYGKIGRKLTRKDLWFESKYNTYRNSGLPPTAICCPGKAAILSAMTPAKTKYFFFVANKGNLSHIFSEEYKSHLIAIKNIKKGLKSVVTPEMLQER
jgi:UPF0755 protein